MLEQALTMDLPGNGNRGLILYKTLSVTKWIHVYEPPCDSFTRTTKEISLSFSLGKVKNR